MTCSRPMPTRPWPAGSTRAPADGSHPARGRRPRWTPSRGARPPLGPARLGGPPQAREGKELTDGSTRRPGGARGLAHRHPRRPRRRDLHALVPRAAAALAGQGRAGRGRRADRPARRGKASTGHRYAFAELAGARRRVLVHHRPGRAARPGPDRRPAAPTGVQLLLGLSIPYILTGPDRVPLLAPGPRPTRPSSPRGSHRDRDRARPSAPGHHPVQPDPRAAQARPGLRVPGRSRSPPATSARGWRWSPSRACAAGRARPTSRSARSAGVIESSGLTPSCLAINNPPSGLYPGRLLSDDESYEYVAVQVRGAAALGFPVTRVGVETSPASAGAAAAAGRGARREDRGGDPRPADHRRPARGRAQGDLHPAGHALAGLHPGHEREHAGGPGGRATTRTAPPASPRSSPR